MQYEFDVLPTFNKHLHSIHILSTLHSNFLQNFLLLLLGMFIPVFLANQISVVEYQFETGFRFYWPS